MIELRGMHLGNIARSPAESVRPDLWPDHAWVPALGCTGGVLYDLCGDMHMVPGAGAYTWTPEGLLINGLYEEKTGYPSITRNIIPDRPFCAYSHHSLPTPVTRTAWTQLGLSGFSSGARCYRFGIFQGPAPLVNFSLWGRDGVQTNLTSIDLSPSVAWGFSQPKLPTTLIAQWTGSVFLAAIIRADRMTLGSAPWAGGVYNPAYPPINYLGNRDSDSIWGAGGGVHSWGVIPHPISISEMFALHADPLLPFRRRQPVFYSVPSGSTENPAAMMMAL